MTSKNNAVANAARAIDCDDPVNASKTSRTRLKPSSEAHEKPATSSHLPTTRKRAGFTASAEAPAASDASETVAKQPGQTKASIVEALLTREGGASLAAMSEATGWQSHTCRAFLTGLRKKGRGVIRASDKEGTSIYLIAMGRSNAPAPATEQTEAESN